MFGIVVCLQKKQKMFYLDKEGVVTVKYFLQDE